MDVFLKRQDVRRRRQWGKRLRQAERALLSLLVVVVGFAMLYGLYRLVFMGFAFSVERVEVEGNWSMLEAGDVARRSGVEAGDNLFWISVEDIHEKLSEEPWIKEIAVRRRLPNALCIYVEEYKPVAIVASNDFYFVDGDGKLIKRVESGEGKDLPVISGLSVGSDGGMGDGDRARLNEMLAILKAFDASLFGRSEGLAEINYDDVQGYSIITRQNPMHILMGKEDASARIMQINRMTKAITAGRPPIRYMIANENGRVIVRYRPS
jgi:cell division septal protein FtsQ